MAAKRHQCPDKFKKVRNHVNNVINRSRNEYFKFKKYLIASIAKMLRKYGKASDVQ